MPLAVLELNDQSLLIQAEGGLTHAEPGFARLTPHGIESGESARATAWLEPQNSYNQHWCHLNETPLPTKQAWARHHADIAYAQLGRLWRGAGSPAKLVILAPGSFTDAQLSLLLGMVGALPSRTLAVIDSALAGCLEIGHEALFIDLQLHQCVLTLCRRSKSAVSIIEQEVFSDLGVMQIYNSVARHVSDLLIRSYRYDPLHASETEQAIFDQLPVWLTRLRWEDEVSEVLHAGPGELPFILHRKDVMELIGERLAGLRSVAARHDGSAMILSHPSGLLAGLAEDFTRADIAGQSAGPGHVISHQASILGQTEGQCRMRSLQLSAAEPGQADGQARLATHVLHHDRALPLSKPVSIRVGEQGLELVNGIDKDAELTLVLRNRSLETVKSAAGIAASLPPLCRAGESIVVDGHQLKLIEVQDG